MTTSPRSRLIPLAIGQGSLATYLDGTLINAVFPAILEEFDGGVATTSWVINAANLALAIGLVLGGRLTDAAGRRRTFVIGLIGSSTFALLCALASSLGALILFRVGVGISNALLLASSMALISSAVAPERRARAFGLYAALGGVGSILGPVLVTISNAYLTWRWAFVMVSPIALVGVTLALRCLPAERERRAVRVNWASGLLVGLALGALLFALSSGPRIGWSSLPVAAAAAGAIVLGALVLAIDRRSREPIFPPALRSRAYASNLLGVLAIGLVMGVGLLGLPLFVTEVQADSFARASMTLAPAALVSVISAIVSGFLAGRFGYRLPSGLGLAAAVLALFALATLAADSSRAQVLLLSGFSGIGLGMGTPAMAGSALAAARDADAGTGSGWFHAVRILGIALGVVAFAVLASQPVDPAAARDLAGNVAHALPDGVRLDVAARYQRAFLICAGLSGLIMVTWLGLVRRSRAT